MSPTERRSSERRRRAEDRPVDERLADLEFRLREVVMLLRVVVIVASGNLIGRLIEVAMR